MLIFFPFPKPQIVNDGSNKDAEAESFVAFYDIFVRNAFGNYRTVIKESIYSPLMGSMLAFLNSPSLEFRRRETYEVLGYPDEVRVCYYYDLHDCLV